MLLDSQANDPNDKMEQYKEILSLSAKYREMDEHRIPLEELYSRLNVDPAKGLSNAEALNRKSQFGINEIIPKKVPLHQKFLRQRVGQLTILLLLGGIALIVVYAAVIHMRTYLNYGITMLLLSLFMGYIAYKRAIKFANTKDYKKYLPEKARVWREGTEMRIERINFVPGDIVLLRTGERLPADVRIINSQYMQITHDFFTKKCENLQTNVTCTNPGDPLETENLAFMGDCVMDGAGRGVVIKIGSDTVMSQVVNNS